MQRRTPTGAARKARVRLSSPTIKSILTDVQFWVPVLVLIAGATLLLILG